MTVQYYEFAYSYSIAIPGHFDYAEYTRTVYCRSLNKQDCIDLANRYYVSYKEIPEPEADHTAGFIIYCRTYTIPDPMVDINELEEEIKNQIVDMAGGALYTYIEKDISNPLFEPFYIKDVRINRNYSIYDIKRVLYSLYGLKNICEKKIFINEKILLKLISYNGDRKELIDLIVANTACIIKNKM